jgi:hypothetical protein
MLPPVTRRSACLVLGVLVTAAGCSGSARLSPDLEALRAVDQITGPSAGTVVDLASKTLIVDLVNAGPSTIRRLKALHPDGYRVEVRNRCPPPNRAVTPHRPDAGCLPVS